VAATDRSCLRPRVSDGPGTGLAGAAGRLGRPHRGRRGASL